jgi:hypothetical protein
MQHMLKYSNLLGNLYVSLHLHCFLSQIMTLSSHEVHTMKDKSVKITVTNESYVF